MATINDIGIPGVGSGILHPKHKNRWRVTFANMGGGTDSQPVSMQAISLNRPKLNFEEITLHRYNSIAYVAGKHSWDPITMTLQDDISGSASAVVQAQVQKQQWLIGAEGQWLATAAEGSFYKFVTYLDMLDGNDTVIEKWTVEGCYLSNVSYGDLSYDSGEPVTIELSIRYDHARQNIFGYNDGPGVATGGPGRR
jgi:hypothetical protein